jgi:RND family efflux transporter MFP subunit
MAMVGAALALGGGLGQTQQASTPGPVDAVTAARYDLKLGFTEGGKVIGTPVKPGTKVEKGQKLIELDDREGASLVALYQLRTNSDVEVKAAQAKLKLAQLEEKNLSTLIQQNAASPFEYEKAKVSTEVARYELELAQRQQKETADQLDQAVARHDKYSLVAPIAGMIEAVLVNEGESVEALKPVLRMVVTDPLWIDTAVPTDQTLKLKVGDPAWAQPALPGHTHFIQGKIIFVAEVADAASDTRLIRVEIPNTESVPAGGHVMVSFTAPPTPTAAAVKPEGS